ncbi:MAG TPA: TonB-dependent receptor, partial [Bryobacterales bacterium]|nr:TonB-dependent receptor [Bryobacterales bacterium]
MGAASPVRTRRRRRCRRSRQSSGGSVSSLLPDSTARRRRSRARLEPLLPPDPHSAPQIQIARTAGSHGHKSAHKSRKEDQMARLAIWLLLPLTLAGGSPANPGGAATGTLRGRVVLAQSGEALPGATVHLEELDRTTQTDLQGEYRFENVPPGSYHLRVHVSSTLEEAVRPVQVREGETAVCDFSLRLAVVRQEVTVTASGRPQSAFDAFQAVETRNSFELAEEIAPSIGETLANSPGNGVAKRSFGPGSERPIIRGFDGDRVLMMQDGIRTGTLSSQSGDHGELIDVGNLDEVEIVKGPATLLYGGSAVGGVVNMISRHHAVHEHPHQGLRGHIGGSAGSANGFASGSAAVEYGRGKWMLWAGGG